MKKDIWWLAKALLVTVSISITAFIFAQNLIDFRVYYAAGQSLLAGRTDLYAPDFALGSVMDYRYPPFFLLVFFPLWVLPYKIAAYLWTVLNIVEVIGSVWIVQQTIQPLKKDKKVWIIIFFTNFPCFVMALHYGNVQLLTTFLLFLSFYFLSREKLTLTALTLALTISIKLVPIIILPYFVIRKQWYVLLLFAVFMFFINLSPSLYFNFAKNNLLLKTWVEHVLINQEFHEINGPINLSLKGQLHRLFTEVDYKTRIDGDIKYPSINVARFSESVVDNIWKTVSALTYLVILSLIFFKRRLMSKLACKYQESNIEKHIFSWEMALIIGSMLFIGPLTSKIYFVALIWPVASLAAFAFEVVSLEAMFIRRLLIFGACINSILPLLPGRSLQRLLLVLGIDFYLNLIFFLSLIGLVIYFSEHMLKTTNSEVS